MKRLLLAVVVNSVALWAAHLLVSGVRFGTGADSVETIKTVVLVGVVFGVINWMAGLVRFVALPLTVITFGLFSLVINALVLMAVSGAADSFGLAFQVDRFWWDAVLGAVVVAVASMVLRAVLPDPK